MNIHLFELNKKTQIIIISSLVIILIILFIIISLLPRRKTDNQTNSSPTPSVQDTEVIPTYIITITPKALPQTIYDQFKNPVKYQDISIELMPRTGTFLVYYEGDVEKAKQTFITLMFEQGLSYGQYNVDYLSIDPITPLPRPFNTQ